MYRHEMTRVLLVLFLLVISNANVPEMWKDYQSYKMLHISEDIEELKQHVASALTTQMERR